MPDRRGWAAMLRRVCADRRRLLLPRQPTDLDGCLLSKRPGAERSEQKSVQQDRHHPDQDAAAAMLLGRPDTGAQRLVLSGGEHHLDRRLLFGCDHDARPQQLPGSDSSHHQGLRVRLHQNAGRELLQQSSPQRGRQDLQNRTGALSTRAVPRSQWGVRAGAERGLSVRADARSPRQLHAADRAAALSVRPDTRSQRQLPAAGGAAALPAGRSAQYPRRLRHCRLAVAARTAKGGADRASTPRGHPTPRVHPAARVPAATAQGGAVPSLPGRQVPALMNR
jgi:hypothetical protein